MAKIAKTEQEEPLEKKLWKAADKLRKNMDAAEYKHVALGLIFLKYISDAFEEQYQKLVTQKSEGADPEDKNEYLADKIFFVPVMARWTYIQGRATQPTIGKDIDDAMDAIEKDNPSLRGVLPKVFAQEKLDKTSLGGLVNLVGSATLGTKEAQSKDILGQVYEYFLGQFALAEGKKGGQFYTPPSIVRLLVEVLEPYEGRVFDPCCGSGGMFVQSEKFIKSHQDNYKKKGKVGLSLNPVDRISIYGQESNQTTWRLAKMNLSIRGIDSSNVKWNNEGSFLNDAHKDLKADFIIANPPFNDSDWSGDLLRTDGRWTYGLPAVGNANFAWVQHMIYHLSPNGKAGIVLGNSSLSAINTGETIIREALIQNDLVECIVALPKQLFFNTSIPACLWFVSKNKQETETNRKRKNELLMIDARALGKQIDSTRKELTDYEIEKIASTFHQWKEKNSDYENIQGFCKSVTIEELIANDFNLSPNRYIELIEIKKDEKSFDDLTDTIVDEINSDYNIRIKLEKQLQKELSNLGYNHFSQTAFSTANNDALIELNNSLFKNWFIDFQIPKFKGFEPKILEPTKYVKDFGNVPKIWGVLPLTQVSQVVDCLHTKKPSALDFDTGNQILQVFNISSNGLLKHNKQYFVAEKDYADWTKNIEVKEGDCIITNTGRVGAVAQIPKNKKFAIGRNMTAVRPNEEFITPTFLINYLLSDYMKIQTYRQTDIGTILDSLNVKGIKQILFLIPNIEVVTQYEKIARPIRELIEMNNDIKDFNLTLTEDEVEMIED